jgi:hypothetical protein
VDRELVTKKEMEARLEEETWSGTVTTAVFTALAFLLLLPCVQQAVVMAQQAAALPRVPTLSAGLDPVAGNVGAMWLQLTPLGCPNEFRMITENSTGAFESMLIGLST